MHESQLHALNSFVTLTYDDEHLPPFASLNYRDFQLFLKRLRKAHAPKGRIRFFMCGEYGELGRPHYHAILFGIAFKDLRVWSSRSGTDLWTSEACDRLWRLGRCIIGQVTMQSAGYVARYSLKKITGDLADAHYRVVDPATGETAQRVPEFARMSLKPGIGAEWLRRYQRDVYPTGITIHEGRKQKAPRFYDRKFEVADPDQFDELKADREWRAYQRRLDNVEARLLVKEEVLKARLAFKKRALP